MTSDPSPEASQAGAPAVGRKPGPRYRGLKYSVRMSADFTTAYATPNRKGGWLLPYLRSWCEDHKVNLVIN